MDFLATILDDTLKTIDSAGGWTWILANRYNRLDKLAKKHAQTINTAVLGEAQRIEAELKKVYRDYYARVMAELKGTPKRLMAKKISEAINEPWSGMSWRERLRINGTNTLNKLKQAITKSAWDGNPVGVGDAVRKHTINFATTSKTIIDVEASHVRYVAQTKAYKDCGIKKLQRHLGHAEHCNHCESLDNKVYKVGEEPMLPEHPHCKCYYTPLVK